MISVQEKFLNEIERRVRAHKLDPAISRDFANCGQIFVQRGFHTYATIRYDFQGSHCGIHISGPAVGYTRPKLVDRPPIYRFTQRNHHGKAEVSFHVLEVSDGGRINYLWEVLERVLIRAFDLAADEDEIDEDLCPGCGAEPGAGVTEGCDEPDGCGYWRELQRNMQ